MKTLHLILRCNHRGLARIFHGFSPGDLCFLKPLASMSVFYNACVLFTLLVCIHPSLLVCASNSTLSLPRKILSLFLSSLFPPAADFATSGSEASCVGEFLGHSPQLPPSVQLSGEPLYKLPPPALTPSPNLIAKPLFGGDEESFNRITDFPSSLRIIFSLFLHSSKVP